MSAPMSAVRGKADVARMGKIDANDPTATSASISYCDSEADLCPYQCSPLSRYDACS